MLPQCGRAVSSPGTRRQHRVAVASLLVFLASCGGSSGQDATKNPPLPPSVPTGKLQLTGQVVAPSGVDAGSLTAIVLGKISGVAADGSFTALVRDEGVTALVAATGD